MIKWDTDDTCAKKLFSYGALRYEAVQLSLFKRKLNGCVDILSAFDLIVPEIHEPRTITSSKKRQSLITYTGNPLNQVNGIVFDVSSEELEKLDLYEGATYKRIIVRLVSGNSAWVYINVDEMKINYG